tara:strand:- start:3964 stop:4170 length:207 start_codon:yes stop_codon:yes gene_type:complete
MKLDIKTALALGTLLFALSGFYYTTNSRLNDAEIEIKRLQKQIGGLERGEKRLQRMITRHTNKESHQE